jgi:hypothetical protein
MSITRVNLKPFLVLKIQPFSYLEIVVAKPAAKLMLKRKGTGLRVFPAFTWSTVVGAWKVGPRKQLKPNRQLINKVKLNETNKHTLPSLVTLYI